MKQFQERGLKEAGIKLIGTGDVMDDDILNSFGPDALGTITSHHYSAAHDSPENAAFTAAFRAVAPNMRPNFMAVGGWDGMQLVAEALKAAKDTDGDTLLAAMKGRSWTSPRGPVTISAETRDITQDVHIRRVESRENQLWNLEFDRIAQVPA
jgi:branched-chain amino acid transport system substrate-binding protein